MEKERGCRDGERVTESREAGREGMERTRKREGREGRTRGRGVSEVLWKTKMGASKRERREEKNEREIVRREREGEGHVCRAIQRRGEEHTYAGEEGEMLWKTKMEDEGLLWLRGGCYARLAGSVA